MKGQFSAELRTQRGQSAADTPERHILQVFSALMRLMCSQWPGLDLRADLDWSEPLANDQLAGLEASGGFLVAAPWFGELVSVHCPPPGAEQLRVVEVSQGLHQSIELRSALVRHDMVSSASDLAELNAQTKPGYVPETSPAGPARLRAAAASVSLIRRRDLGNGFGNKISVALKTQCLLGFSTAIWRTVYPPYPRFQDRRPGFREVARAGVGRAAA